MSDGPLIQVEGLSKSFETGDGSLEVLRGLDFEIQAGDRIAIMGQSGVGKSTLLHILGTLDRPTSGKLRFRGEDVFAKSPEELARLRNRFVGFVFQFHHLLPEFSALENVMMPGLLQKRGFREMREAAGKGGEAKKEEPAHEPAADGAGAGDIELDGDVLVLNTANFPAATKANEVLLVEFYAPWQADVFKFLEILSI